MKKFFPAQSEGKTALQVPLMAEAVQPLTLRAVLLWRTASALQQAAAHFVKEHRCLPLMRPEGRRERI